MTYDRTRTIAAEPRRPNYPPSVCLPDNNNRAKSTSRKKILAAPVKIFCRRSQRRTRTPPRPARGVHHCCVVTSQTCCDGAAAEAAKPTWPVNAACRLRFPTGEAGPLLCLLTFVLALGSILHCLTSDLPSLKHAAVHTHPTNANVQPPSVGALRGHPPQCGTRVCMAPHSERSAVQPNDARLCTGCTCRLARAPRPSPQPGPTPCSIAP